MARPTKTCATLRVGDAVVELGHRARADQLAEALEAAALLGDRHREQRLALLADLGALGDEAQPVEVHVGAAGDGHEGLALELVRLDVLLDRRHAQRAGRLEDAARVLEHVLDGGADRVGVDDDEVVDQRARQAEGLLAHQLDRGAVGEQADVGQRHALAGAHRAQHRVGVDGLHADHLDLGPHRLDVGGDAGDQPAAADGDEHRVDRALVLAQDLHRDRALAGDHVRVVEGVHEGQALRASRVPARARRRRSSCRRAARPRRRARAPRRSSARGVVTGITITALQPSLRALSATPCAWLPAEAQMTPRCSCSGGRCAILL